MKVTKTDHKPTFTPLTLKITIESKEEWDAIHLMAQYNVSVPKAVAKDQNGSDEMQEETFRQIQDLLDKIHKVL